MEGSRLQHEKIVRNDLNSIIQKIRLSWDNNVITRAFDLEQETDYSYINIIKPWIMKKILYNTKVESTIMDIGCGCGYLTNEIYKSGRKKIKGIDISPVSIRYAQKKYPHISFSCQDICEINGKKDSDICLAVMMLNYVPDIKNFFLSVQNILLPGGKIMAVIPHPYFWPKRHLLDCEYSYEQENLYTYHFATKGRSDYTSNVLYFHRKLDTYLNCAIQSGYQLVDFQEFTDEYDCKYPDILYLEFILLS